LYWISIMSAAQVLSFWKKKKYHAEYAALGFSVFMNEGRFIESLGFWKLVQFSSKKMKHRVVSRVFHCALESLLFRDKNKRQQLF